VNPTRLARVLTASSKIPQWVRMTETEGCLPVFGCYNPIPMKNTGILSEPVTLLSPLPQTPSKIIAVGLNYQAHIEEMRHENVSPDPVLFLKAPSAIVDPYTPIVARADCGSVDYEGELAVVIGQTCRDVSEADALPYVLGYTIANDVTARDLQRQDKQWGRAKNFDTFCPMGPYLLLNTGQNPGDFVLTTELDGKQVQHASVSQMRFSVPFLVSYLSRIMTLHPGDVILTGTPEGVGPMENGQTVRIGIPEIGWLENPFVREPAKTSEIAMEPGG
jgi:2-keto-4-pentenoate hydratase/2-oxohepta-3-ene-1,7-dioic acid hydratase in catechol pathway